ncbi:hypothetical protein [Nonomuraea zeae]|uniref:Uncharacterized protein n=1 Tax=Nonomuraea zeae TaxID=1642303 RepID=A0A5S4GAH9_9ACTN|nr:hypothetical protein [Nonomuraea zeae]TMR30017.1 hypothetical protein ETD85_30470 [Nonomuraea zeae]
METGGRTAGLALRDAADAGIRVGMAGPSGIRLPEQTPPEDVFVLMLTAAAEGPGAQLPPGRPIAYLRAAL